MRTRLIRCGLMILALSGVPPVNAQSGLVEAVKARDDATVRSLLQQRVNVNEPQADGGTALHWAAYWGDSETTSLLIRAGGSANAADEYGATPLTVACNNGNGSIVELLLKAGADPNATLPTGETALMACARAGDLEAVKFLLNAGAAVDARESRMGQTALMWAVAQKHAAVAEALIQGGADIHARSEKGFTPLLFAARVGDVDSARVLLSAGADLNEGMADKGTPGGPLLMAAASGHEAFSIFLLEKGAEPNVSDGGATPLHYAVMEGMAYLRFRPGMPQAAKALLAHGADPNARFIRSSVSGLGGGASGATPFLLAAASSNPEMMRILVSAGADPLLPSATKVTPLMAAAGLLQVEAFTQRQERDALECVELAVELGADVNAASDSGRTALHGATKMVANTIIQFLAAKGANLNAKDIYQQTPLSIASGIHLHWVPKGEELGEEGAIRKDTADLLLNLGATPLNTPGYFTQVEEDSDVYRLNPKREAIPGLDNPADKDK